MPFLAHFGIGLATKRFFPQIPLWALLISTMVLDILFNIFIFAFWPSHGLFMAAVWSASAMLITVLITTLLNSKKTQNTQNFYVSMIIGLLVFSHWVLDFIGWPGGLPLLFNDSLTIGLGVFSTWFGALAMEIGIFLPGLAIYIHYIIKIKKIKVIDDHSSEIES